MSKWFWELTTYQKFRVLIVRLHLFIIKLVAFNKPLCIGMEIHGSVHVTRKAIIANCTFCLE
jgi:hypothetical protein